MSVYTFKIVGVTFGNRQKNLSKLFNNSKREKCECYDVELRSFTFEDEPALGVYFDDLEVGNIAADQVEMVSEILERASSIDGEVCVNGYSVDDIVSLKDYDEWTREEIKDSLAEEKIYSARIHLFVIDSRNEEPEPGSPEPHEPDKYEKKLIAATEKAQRKEAKRRAKQQKLEEKIARKMAKRKK